MIRPMMMVVSKPKAEDQVAHETTDQPEQDIDQHAIAAALHELASEPTCNASDDQAPNDAHKFRSNRFYEVPQRKRPSPWGEGLLEKC